MFEIIINKNLPELSFHLKVLQNQEKVLDLNKITQKNYSKTNNSGLSTQSPSHKTTPNRIKLTYSEEWSSITKDRELVKATPQGFMLYLQLTDKLNLKFHIKPKNVKFIGTSAFGYNPIGIYKSLKQNIGSVGMESTLNGLEVPL